MKEGWLRGMSALAAVLIVANTLPVYAESDSVAMEEVLVVGENDIDQALKERKKKFTGTVDVVTPKEIELNKTTDVGDILEEIPGVNYLDEDGRGLRPDIGIRGLNPRRSEFVVLLKDGVPVQPSFYSDPAAYYGVPAERVGGIEVLKGGASTILYGPNSVGGVVNFISRPLSTKHFQGIFDGIVDNNGGSGNIFFSGATGRTGWGLEYLRKEGSGFRDNNGFRINDTDGRVQVKLGESTVKAHAQYYDERSETPGALSPQQVEQDITQTTKPNDVFYGERMSSDVTYDVPLSENQRLSGILYANYFRRDWYIQDFAGASGLALAQTATQNLREFKVYAWEPKYTLGYGLGAGSELEVGGRLYADCVDRTTATGPVTARRGEGTTTSDADLETKVFAGYLQNRFGLTQNFNVTPGLRYENIHQEQFNTVTRRSGTANTNIVLPNLGTTYQMPRNTLLFANIGRAFRPPTFADAFDATTSADRNLDPSFAWTYETGVRTHPWTWLNADLAAFLFDFKDQVVISGGVASNFDTKSQGLEGNFEIGLGRLIRGIDFNEPEPDNEFSLGAGFTLVDTEFKNGTFSGKELPYAPNQQYTWFGRYDWKNRASAQLQGRWVGEQFADNANTVAHNASGTLGEIPSYTVWDLNLLASLTDRISLSAGVRNLFDKEYIVQRDTFFRGVVPGADRTYYAGTKITFGGKS